MKGSLDRSDDVYSLLLAITTILFFSSTMDFDAGLFTYHLFLSLLSLYFTSRTTFVTSSYIEHQIVVEAHECNSSIC
jgi:hypothetical protein